MRELCEAARWHAPYSSNPHDRWESKHFKDLLALGPGIIPHLVQMLREEATWTPLDALFRLVPPEDQPTLEEDDAGRLDRLTALWVQWGDQR